MNNWRGCKNVFWRSNGQMSDPDIVIKTGDDTYVFNYYDIEDALWYDFCEDRGYDPAEVENNSEVEADFDKYCQDYAYDYCVGDVIAGGYFEDSWDPYEEEYTWHYSYLPAEKRSMKYELSWRGVADSDWYAQFADHVTREDKIYYFDGQEIGDIYDLQEYLDNKFGDSEEE